MEKTPRYTQKERNMVLGYAAQHKDIIENKRTDAESNRKKDEVWRQIAKEFNARVYHQRSAKQLRQLYKNMKLLLKKDLCGEDKGNRTFMDLLNTISQQESVTQYINELSPGGLSGRLQKYDDDYDDIKMSSVGYGHDMDTDVIVIKSEDLSDNEHSRTMDDMDDDDDDALSSKDIPEVCLEEEDEELITDSRHSPNSNSNHPMDSKQNSTQEPKPDVTIQNVGNIRVGSIGSLANLSKALQNGSASGALTLTTTSNNNNNNNNNNNHSNHNSNSNNQNNLRQSSAAEQAQQQLLFNNLGLSAVNPVNAAVQRAAVQNSRSLSPQLPALQRANTLNANGNGSGNTNSAANAVTQFLMNFTNGGNYGAKLNGLQLNTNHLGSANLNGNSGNNGSSLNNGFSKNFGSNSNLSSLTNSNLNNNNNNVNNNNNNNNSDYLMYLEIEEKRRKIDLLNAQTEYWKTLTKKLETNQTLAGPACGCHFSNPLNTSGSSS